MYRQFRSNIRVRLIEDEFKTFTPGDKPMKAHDIMRRLRQTITTNVKKTVCFLVHFCPQLHCDVSAFDDFVTMAFLQLLF